MGVGSVVSKIIELETDSKAQYEHAHLKNKNEVEDAHKNKGKMMTLLRDLIKTGEGTMRRKL